MLGYIVARQPGVVQAGGLAGIIRVSHRGSDGRLDDTKGAPAGLKQRETSNNTPSTQQLALQQWIAHSSAEAMVEWLVTTADKFDRQ